MIGLDTNILVRYLTQDDEKQAVYVNELLEAHISVQNKAVISKIVLCELSWVLSRSYRYSREEIFIAINQILITQEFVIEDHENAQKALLMYRNGSAGYADYLIAQTHSSLGAKYTLSFDKEALKSALFESVQSNFQ